MAQTRPSFATPPRINRMAFVGQWYPADSSVLNSWFRAPGVPPQQDPQNTMPQPRLAVLPHAGLYYSLRGQRAFWDRLKAQGVLSRPPWDAVVIVAPSHYHSLPGHQIVSGDFGGHETPLGTLEGLENTVPLGDRIDSTVVEQEHAVELLLPAVAHYLGTEIPVGAVVVGALRDPAVVRAAAARLRRRLGERRVLWLVSSDATHYGTRFGWTPHGGLRWCDLAERLEREDGAFLWPALQGDLEAYLQHLATTPSTICGRYALAVATAAIIADGDRPGDHRILDYYSSATVGEDPESRAFVCYLSAAVGGSS